MLIHFQCKSHFQYQRHFSVAWEDKMITAENLTLFILLLLLTFTVISDIKISKIKNYHVLPAALSGIIINTYFYGVEGAKASIAGLLIPVILLGIFFYMGLLGAGDIKLYSAIGALLGWEAGLFIIGYSMLVAGAAAFVKLLGTGEIAKSFRGLGKDIKLLIYTGGGCQRPSIIKNNRHIIRLSPAIAFGTAIHFALIFYGI